MPGGGSQPNVSSQLDDLEQELNGWISMPAQGFHFWRDRMNAVIDAIAGSRSALAIRFNGLNWNRFPETSQTARELIQSLRWMDSRAVSSPAVDTTLFDDELWAYVEASVTAEQWDQVARNACVFVEDRLRRWAIVPPTVTGSLAAFDYALEHERFELGDTTSERDGWRLLGKGIALALRNRSGHRVHEAPDLRRYAFGVLGTVSLLLTEIKNVYGAPPVLPKDVE